MSRQPDVSPALGLAPCIARSIRAPYALRVVTRLLYHRIICPTHAGPSAQIPARRTAHRCHRPAVSSAASQARSFPSNLGQRLLCRSTVSTPHNGCPDQQAAARPHTMWSSSSMPRKPGSWTRYQRPPASPGSSAGSSSACCASCTTPARRPGVPWPCILLCMHVCHAVAMQARHARLTAPDIVSS